MTLSANDPYKITNLRVKVAERLKRQRRNRKIAGVIAVTVMLLLLMYSLSYSVILAPYTVSSGDTLWAIAAKHYPNEHTGAMVWEVMKLNGLSKADIQPGQTLMLPVVE